jgi:hypothetical protein
MPAEIRKRDGRAVPFRTAPIASAIRRAMEATADPDRDCAEELAQLAADHVGQQSADAQVGIEDVQDSVIHILMETGHYDTAMAYARYRDDRERFRRSRVAADPSQPPPDVQVVDGQGRRIPWDRAWLTASCVAMGLDAKAAGEAIDLIAADLAGSMLRELPLPLFHSLMDAALVRTGRHHQAVSRAPLRLDRAVVREAVRETADGLAGLERLGRAAAEQLALEEGLPESVVRSWRQGRLWMDGLDDPRRGSVITATMDGITNPWQILAQAFAFAADERRRWRRLRIVLPPAILGHLERGAHVLLPPIRALAGLATVYLYCDGRTPLVTDWPLAGARVGLATYHEDYLLIRRLQDQGIPWITGPYLMSGGWRRRIAVECAVNAQGLDDEHAQLDALAADLATAAALRIAQLAGVPGMADADVRFALSGLAVASTSGQYLERAIMQEATRRGIVLQRTASLPEDACAHFARLLD